MGFFDFLAWFLGNALSIECGRLFGQEGMQGCSGGVMVGLCFDSCFLRLELSNRS